MKKTLLAMGAATLMAAPLATAISCSDSSDASKTVASGLVDVDGTLKLGFDAGTYEALAPAISAFSKKYGIEIEHVDVDYASLESSEVKPDVFKMDGQASIQEARSSESMFQPLSIEDLSDHKYHSSLDFRSEVEFYQGTWQSVAIPGGDGDSIVGVPIIKSPQQIYIREAWLDDSTTIKAIVPKVEGGFTETDTGIPVTLSNVEKFIMDAGVEGTKMPTIGELPTNTLDSLDGWLTHGPLAMYQRIASVGASAFSGDASPSGNIISYGLGTSLDLDWDIIASIDGLYDADNFHIDDDKVVSEFTSNGFANAETAKALWEGIYGYYQNDTTGVTSSIQPMVSHHQVGEQGDGELVTNKNAAMTVGPTWMHGYIRNNISSPYSSSNRYESPSDGSFTPTTTYGDVTIDDLSSVPLNVHTTDDDGNAVTTTSPTVYDIEFRAIPMPYSESSTESLAIPVGATNVDAAKVFIKFIQQPAYINLLSNSRNNSTMIPVANETNISNLISGNVFIEQSGGLGLYAPSVLNAAADDSYAAPYLSMYKSAYKDSSDGGVSFVEAVDEYNGVPGTWRISTSGQSTTSYIQAWKDHFTKTVDLEADEWDYDKFITESKASFLEALKIIES